MQKFHEMHVTRNDSVGDISLLLDYLNVYQFQPITPIKAPLTQIIFAFIDTYRV